MVIALKITHLATIASVIFARLRANLPSSRPSASLRRWLQDQEHARKWAYGPYMLAISAYLRYIAASRSPPRIAENASSKITDSAFA